MLEILFENILRINNDSNYNLVCSTVKVVTYNLDENNIIISFFSVPSYLFLFLDLNMFDSD